MSVCLLPSPVPPAGPGRYRFSPSGKPIGAPPQTPVYVIPILKKATASTVGRRRRHVRRAGIAALAAYVIIIFIH